jgi:hypothetical protein
MIQRLGTGIFVTSNDESSVALWTSTDAIFSPRTIQYDRRYGVANSACLLRSLGKQWLITGHSEGFLVTWEVGAKDITMRSALSIRSPNPLPSDYRSWNVRGIVPGAGSVVVTGAEDGDLCLIDVLDGKVLWRGRYNKSAKLGINSLARDGDRLLVANCSVGTTDRNLWLFRIGDSKIEPLDSANLVKSPDRKQAFNFAVRFVHSGTRRFFLSSTAEGLLWSGEIVGDKIVVQGNQSIECEGGAALAVEPECDRLAVAAHAIRLYRISAK